ncbi:tyrosine-type recombinase/integrase [Sinorhizobium fredii]|uniref:tyrosine-type recombinase/integrase n=1 Tax=Rhizobium fredii TaxID=380 RepID=UPI0035184AA1
MTKIKHVAWRQGRPRFEPSKTLREKGHKGKDLRHEDGRWFTEGEALDWSNTFSRRLKREKAAAAKAKPAAPKVEQPRAVYPLSRMFEEWLVSPRILGKAEATRRDYRQKARVIETHDPDLWASEVAALDQQICYGLYEQLWERRGLATARGTLRVLSIAIKWAMKTGRVRGLPFNPARDLGMEQLKPRARFLTRLEVDALVTTAESDDFKRVDMADMFICALWTGQRQGDRLNLRLDAFRNGRFDLQQGKTKAIVNPPVAPEYRKRMAAAKRRRLLAGKSSDYAHLNEHTWEQWNAFTYRNLFAEIRTKAAAKVASVATIKEKDFRATAVTWMALAGATLPEICSVTGHSLQGAHQILKHYLALHPEMATTAIDKMVAWYEGNGETAINHARETTPA